MTSPSAKTAARWNRALQGFRFHYAHGGHANDMDTLQGSLSFSPGEAGLLALFAALEVPLARIPPGTRCQAVGQPYSAEEFASLPRRIRAYPDFAEPGLARIFNVPVGLEVYRDHVAILVAGAQGNLWVVTEADFRNALKLERLFAQRQLTFVGAKDVADR